MRQIFLTAIHLYQRYLSPYKGFCCAYRVHTGHASCSALGARTIRRFGVIAGLLLLRQRLQRCSEVHRQHHPVRRPAALQRGDCDLPCDSSFDLPDAKCLGKAGDALVCLDCGCCDGWGKKRERRRGANPR